MPSAFPGLQQAMKLLDPGFGKPHLAPGEHAAGTRPRQLERMACSPLTARAGMRRVQLHSRKNSKTGLWDICGYCALGLDLNLPCAMVLFWGHSVYSEQLTC